MRWEGQSRVGRIERHGNAPPREMIAQWRSGAMDRMRLIDQPEEDGNKNPAGKGGILIFTPATASAIDGTGRRWAGSLTGFD